MDEIGIKKFAFTLCVALTISALLYGGYIIIKSAFFTYDLNTQRDRIKYLVAEISKEVSRGAEEGVFDDYTTYAFEIPYPDNPYNDPSYRIRGELRIQPYITINGMQIPFDSRAAGGPGIGPIRTTP